eukprot:5267747-Amphidinium_carterae.1
MLAHRGNVGQVELFFAFPSNHEKEGRGFCARVSIPSRQTVQSMSSKSFKYFSLFRSEGPPPSHKPWTRQPLSDAVHFVDTPAERKSSFKSLVVQNDDAQCHCIYITGACTNFQTSQHFLFIHQSADCCGHQKMFAAWGGSKTRCVAVVFERCERSRRKEANHAANAMQHKKRNKEKRLGSHIFSVPSRARKSMTRSMVKGKVSKTPSCFVPQ